MLTSSDARGSIQVVVSNTRRLGLMHEISVPVLSSERASSQSWSKTTRRNGKQASGTNLSAERVSEAVLDWRNAVPDDRDSRDSWNLRSCRMDLNLSPVLTCEDGNASKDEKRSAKGRWRIGALRWS